MQKYIGNGVTEVTIRLTYEELKMLRMIQDFLKYRRFAGRREVSIKSAIMAAVEEFYADYINRG